MFDAEECGDSSWLDYFDIPDGLLFSLNQTKKMDDDKVVFLVTSVLESPPEIVARGLIGVDGSNGFIKDAQRVVTEAIERAPMAERRDTSLLKELVRLGLKRFIQKQTGAKPVIMPVIVQV
jgi:mRNA degradation ribonuclease J1/J2